MKLKSLKTRYISKLGCENEGVFNPRIPYHPHIKSDGSLYFDNDHDLFTVCPKTKRRIFLRIGEIISPPFANRHHLKAWVKRWFPIRVNETCGWHVHVSFRKNSYKEALEDADFHSEFLNDLKKWLGRRKISQAFQDRLDNKNDYCPHRFQSCGGAIDYDGCYNTVEFRIFSMVITPRLAQKLIDFTHYKIESWLRANYRRRVSEMRIENEY